MKSLLNTFDRSKLLLDTSLWSAPLANLEKGISMVEAYTDMYHMDVADAHFVPSLLFFPDLVAAVNEQTKKPIHVHLMMEEPIGQVIPFIDAGADIITVHVELGKKVDEVIAVANKRGIAAGLAICVETNLDALNPYLDKIDIILLMGTKIGIKGVGIDPDTESRVKEMKQRIVQAGLKDKIILSVDGGIRRETVPMLYAAGADMITPGSLVYKSDNISQTIDWLHGLKR